MGLRDVVDWDVATISKFGGIMRLDVAAQNPTESHKQQLLRSIRLKLDHGWEMALSKMMTGIQLPSANSKAS